MEHAWVWDLRKLGKGNKKVCWGSISGEHYLQICLNPTSKTYPLGLASSVLSKQWGVGNKKKRDDGGQIVARIGGLEKYWLEHASKTAQVSINAKTEQKDSRAWRLKETRPPTDTLIFLYVTHVLHAWPGNLSLQIHLDHHAPKLIRSHVGFLEVRAWLLCFDFKFICLVEFTFVKLMR